MQRILKVFILTVFSMLLVACATRNGPPAGVTDANVLNTGSAAGIQTQGLGTAGNLVGDDVGPHDGILNRRSFYFKFDSNAVNQKDYPALKAHAQYLMDHSSAKILIEGNTDARGSQEYNVALGQRRADAVKNVLASQGVSSRQIRTISYGAEKPVALGNTEADYQVNRRADVVYEAA